MDNRALCLSTVDDAIRGIRQSKIPAGMVERLSRHISRPVVGRTPDVGMTL